MLGLVNRIDTMKKQRGIGLLELMLALAIIAVLLIMATRYYQSTSQSQKMGQAMSDVNAIIAAAETQRAGDPTAKFDIGDLLTSGYLPKAWGTDALTANPWGGAYTVEPKNSGLSITVAGTPSTSVCDQLAAQMKKDAVSADCADTTITAVYGGAASTTP